MTRIAVTGARGFIGQNLVEAIEQTEGLQAHPIGRETSSEARDRALATSDVVVHLAGANRPEDPAEFMAVNRDMTADLVDRLLARDAPPALLFTSSTKAEEDSAYGRSKRAAEAELARYGEAGGSGLVYRLPNVFGKWARPDYNSAVATFCHNTARDQAIEVHDPDARLDLVHVGDVVHEFLLRFEAGVPPGVAKASVSPVFSTTVGWVAETIRGFSDIARTQRIPDLSDRLVQLLHSTWLAYLPPERRVYSLTERTDPRGRLAELLKSDHAGQMFVSTTRPGVVRGNHGHRVKVEKFMVLQGEGVIRIRDRRADDVQEIAVSGASWSVVDIPPGTVHNIENTGPDELLVLFWASEIFDPEAPDTWSGRV